MRTITADQLIVGHRNVVKTWRGEEVVTITEVWREEADKWFPTGKVVVVDSDSDGLVRIFHPEDTVPVI